MSNIRHVVQASTSWRILEALYGEERLSFADIRRATGTTTGNLQYHLKKLKEEGLISHKKSVPNARRAYSFYSLTASGREKLSEV